MINKVWKGSSARSIFKKHYCFNCGARLKSIEHRKVIYDTSPEAIYYNPKEYDNFKFGPYEFICRIYYCPTCMESIEPLTQHNLEDIDIYIRKVRKYFLKRKRLIEIHKLYETHDCEIRYSTSRLDLIQNLCLFIDEENKKSLIYKVPISRKDHFERPYYFNITKRKLIKFIKKNSK